MFVIKMIGIIILVVFLPMIVGKMLEQVFKCDYDNILAAGAFRYVMGNVFLWAMFQLVAVPLIIMKCKLTTLIAMWCILSMIVVLVIGSINKRQCSSFVGKSAYKYSLFDGMNSNYVLIFNMFFVLTVIGYQCYKYVRYMHIDEDDSRFIVNAVDAYSYNTMMLTNPTTGEYMGTWVGDLAKDVASPWMMYVATIAKICHIHPTIFAHTLLPVFLLVMSYSAYYLIGHTIFRGSMEKSLLFVGLVAFVNMYFSDAIYMQSFFSLVRIWQGKATLAAVMIPFMLYLLMRLYYDENKRNFGLIAIAAISMCLLSGMGIFFSGIMVGTYGMYFVFVKKKLNYIPYVIMTCIPTVLYGMVYALLR